MAVHRRHVLVPPPREPGRWCLAADGTGRPCVPYAADESVRLKLPTPGTSVRSMSACARLRLAVTHAHSTREGVSVPKA